MSSEEESIKELTEDLGKINLEGVSDNELKEEVIEKEPATSQLKSNVILFSEEDKRMLFERISKFAKDESENIKKEQTLNRNLPFAFLGMGELGEELSLYMYPNSFGNASKGGIAFDNLEYIDDENRLKENNIKLAREIKFVSLDGSKICTNCNNKAPRFQNICILCRNTEFKEKFDSRAGIKAKEHFTYSNVLSEYIIFVSKYNDSTNTLNLKCHKFFSDNTYFNNYLKHINENTKAGNANFVPYSFDWHLSGPMLLFNLDIDNEGFIKENFFDLENKKYDDFPLKIIQKQDTLCLEDEQKSLYESMKDEDIINYELAIEIFKMRKKNCGKARGTVSRNMKTTKKKSNAKKDTTKEGNKTKKSPSPPK